MAGFHPRPEELPSAFPIFPLARALLLPQGRLPLNIFEPRYVAMVEDVLGQHRMFGMIQPDAQAVETEHGPGLFRVGCLGRLSAFSETEDGRYLITLTGVIRFRFCEELGVRRGYRRARADFSPYGDDLDLAPHPIGIDRETLLDALRSYFAARSFEANWEAIGAMRDDVLVATLCMVCPFDPAEKQALLEAATDADRAASLLALLRMGQHDPSDGPHGPVS